MSDETTGDGGDGAPGPDPAAAIPPFDAPEPASRARLYALGALAAVLAVVGAAFAFWPEDEVAAPPPTTTTTTTTATTTTVETLPANSVEVAVVRPEVAQLDVRDTQPDGWDTTPVAIVSEDPLPIPPFSQETVPERVALPTPEAPIVGRRATEDGWQFDNPGPYEPREPLTLLVTERRGEWAKVQLPVRPNGTEGWIRVADVELSVIDHRIELNVAERMLRAYDGGELVVETPVVVGDEGRPTPTGRFFITDVVPQTSPAFGPVALATNAYSETIDEFDTGVPVVALHGTNRPELVGSAVSNGCVRIPNDAVTQLAETLPRGTPLYVWP